MHVETINEIQRNCFMALSHETLHINSPNKSGTELYGKLTGRWDAKIITTNSKRKDAGNEAGTNRNRAGPRVVGYTISTNLFLLIIDSSTITYGRVYIHLPFTLIGELYLSHFKPSQLVNPT